ncbi:hypothetical protein QOT17_007472 [Balamuthia mandrillaris]
MHTVIAPELVTKEAFHNLSPDALQQSNWSSDTNYQSFIHAVRQQFINLPKINNNNFIAPYDLNVVQLG